MIEKKEKTEEKKEANPHECLKNTITFEILVRKELAGVSREIAWPSPRTGLEKEGQSGQGKRRSEGACLYSKSILESGFGRLNAP
jgi:hypothetical protein